MIYFWADPLPFLFVGETQRWGQGRGQGTERLKGGEVKYAATRSPVLGPK